MVDWFINWLFDWLIVDGSWYSKFSRRLFIVFSAGLKHSSDCGVWRRLDKLWRRGSGRSVIPGKISSFSCGKFPGKSGQSPRLGSVSAASSFLHSAEQHVFIPLSSHWFPPSSSSSPFFLFLFLCCWVCSKVRLADNQWPSFSKLPHRYPSSLRFRSKQDFQSDESLTWNDDTLIQWFIRSMDQLLQSVTSAVWRKGSSMRAELLALACFVTFVGSSTHQ